MKQLETTQESVLHVDETPNEEYPIRILKAYRENCNCKWVCSEPNPLIDSMNEHCDQRAEILDKAIKILEENK